MRRLDRAKLSSIETRVRNIEAARTGPTEEQYLALGLACATLPVAELQAMRDTLTVQQIRRCAAEQLGTDPVQVALATLGVCQRQDDDDDDDQTGGA